MDEIEEIAHNAGKSAETPVPIHGREHQRSYGTRYSSTILDTITIPFGPFA